MPSYSFKCKKCHALTQVSASIHEAVPEPKCCDEHMARDYKADGPPYVNLMECRRARNT